MKRRTVFFQAGPRQAMRGREALLSLSGVVAAEPVPGGGALRVWQGDELEERALLDALRRAGISGAVVR